MTKSDKNIYQKLKELRRARGLTVVSLAEKMGEDSQKVGRVERGERSLTIDYLIKVTKALEMPMDSLLGTSDEKDKDSPKTLTDTASSDILNDIVLFVEDYSQRVTPPLNPLQKAKFISKIYEMTIKFPKEIQKQFLTSLLELYEFSAKL